MYGQKQIISCLMFVIFMTIINFYKSIIKRDKEIVNFRQTELLKRKFEEQILPSENQQPDDIPPALNEDNKQEKKHSFIEKMLEYDDKCFDIHALLFKPNYDKISDVDFQTNINPNKIKLSDNTENSSSGCDGIAERTADKIIRKSTNTMDKVIVTSDSSSLAYVFVFILLGSLIKAAFDISKQFKKQSNSDNETELSRRCSLQEYSLMKHKQRHSKVESLLKKSVKTQRSLDSTIKIPQQIDITRRMSSTPQDYNNGSGLLSETNTQTKSGKLLAPIGIVRRPSMDSFSEDDSSPDVKRRVRMIHRH